MSGLGALLDAAGIGVAVLEPRETMDQALLGVVRNGNGGWVAAYDHEALVGLFEADGMDTGEALDWIWFNCAGKVATIKVLL